MDHETPESKSPYDARALANYVLDLADERGNRLTQIQLIKIIYFANGWFLAAFRRPLVKQNFEAWEHGPVLRVVRDCFKVFGKKPITGRAERIDLETGELITFEYKFDEKHAQFIREIFEIYHVHDAWELSEMTHEKGSPWDRIWNSDEPIGRLGLRISEDEIRDHFESLPRRFGTFH
jgi:uncharacterized phage-associated protein